MRFLRTDPSDLLPTLLGPRVVLRGPDSDDLDAWKTLRGASRAFLEPWEPLWPVDDLEKPAFRRRLSRWTREIRDGVTFPYFVCARETGALLGGITLAQVRRGVTQAGTVGYWMGEPHAGRGYMSEAVGVLAVHAFGTLGLHRLEAACLPQNGPSIRLLEKVGFAREGLARAYLCIAGRWRDHILWGLLADDPLFPARPAPGAAVFEAASVGFAPRTLVEDSPGR